MLMYRYRYRYYVLYVPVLRITYGTLHGMVQCVLLDLCGYFARTYTDIPNCHIPSIVLPIRTHHTSSWYQKKHIEPSDILNAVTRGEMKTRKSDSTKQEGALFFSR